MSGLQARIAAILGQHVKDQLTNYDADDGRRECGCGKRKDRPTGTPTSPTPSSLRLGC